MTVLADVQGILAAAIPSRTVYRGAVPDGTLPARYLLVRTSEGDEEGTRMVDAPNLGTVPVWVTSVSRNANPVVAHDEAAWGAAKVRAVLRDARPYGAWRIRAVASQPPARDDSQTATTFAAVEQFTLRITV